MVAFESNANVISAPISRRYRLLDVIGTGGMGVVFRAFDRLTRQPVALKRVFARADNPQLGTRFAEQAHLRRALASEFQIMASLRHPNIASVLDYGFDAEQQPYLALQLLEDAERITDASVGRSLPQKLELLVQLLHALAYLHRRGVIHRDLKPANVLVTQHQVKVLDFGLAALVEKITPSEVLSGTLAYLAPEVIDGQAASAASDLYAVGVIAYEMLAGRHPFNTTGNTFVLLDEVMNKPADTASLGLDPRLRHVLDRLLAKDPASRFNHATNVIEALRLALRQTLQEIVVVETGQTRESFLQAARFVGREAELAQLQAALSGALNGIGGAWLIGGESGVGKSRLVNEARVQALVAGALVVSGQAVDQGSPPFALWWDIFRRLTLEAEADEATVATLASVVPDLMELIERPVTPAPHVDSAAARGRLSLALHSLIRAQGHPVLIILEDLQWADEASTDLLARMSRLIRDLPVLLLGTYRTDERPDLPASVPDIQHLTLLRLNEEEIAALSEAMLGTAGRQDNLVQMLRRETEGNAFFLVEVARALAEQVGQLDKIGSLPLPAHIFTGGMGDVVQRRLNRLDDAARPLLDAAAVAGRQLDLNLLRHLCGQSDEWLSAWLFHLAEAAVLDVESDVWRFAHDKLREGVLAAMPTERLTQLHGDVGAALETVYRDQLTPYYADLAYHFGRGGITDSERWYTFLAGEQAAAQYANAEAAAYFSRALELTPVEDYAARWDIIERRERIYHLQGARDLQRQDAETLADLATQFDSPAHSAEAAMRLVDWAHAVTEVTRALEAAERAVQFAEAHGSAFLRARAYLLFGKALSLSENYARAEEVLEEVIALAREVDAGRVEAEGLYAIGSCAFHQVQTARAKQFFEQARDTYLRIGDTFGAEQVVGYLGLFAVWDRDYERAEAYYARGLRLHRLTGNRHHEGTTLFNLGVMATRRRQFGKAERWYQEALALCQQIGHRMIERNIWYELGRIASALGDHDEAMMLLDRSTQMSWETESPSSIAWSYAFTAEAYLERGDFLSAKTYAERCIEYGNGTGETLSRQVALMILGMAEIALGNLEIVAPLLMESIELANQVNQDGRRVDAQTGLIELALARGDIPGALSVTEEVLPHLNDDTLDGAFQPMRAYLFCFRALRAAGDSRASAVLAQGIAELQRWIQEVPDRIRQCTMIENVPIHRALWEHWQEAANRR